MTYDGATWGAFACVFSALAGVLTVQAYRRRGLAAGVRGAGWTLLPVAAWLTGTLRLAAEVLTDVGDWATRLVFSPTVWLGVVLAGVAVVLLVGGGILSRRGGGRRAPATPEKARPGEATGTPSRKAGGRSLGKARGKVAAKDAATDTGGGEFDDIEEILRRHGIS